jgi:hypothetical protein
MEIEILTLLLLINQVTVTEANDRWEWSLAIQDGFWVKYSLYVFLERTLLNHTRDLHWSLLLSSIFGRVACPQRFVRWRGNYFLTEFPLETISATEGLLAMVIIYSLCVPAILKPGDICFFIAGLLLVFGFL